MKPPPRVTSKRVGVAALGGSFSPSRMVAHSAAAVSAVPRSKLKWIYRAQARWAELNPQQAEKEFVSGKTVYFLGQSHRLDFRPEARRGLERIGDVFVLHTDDKRRAEGPLKDFYRAEGRTRLPNLVRQHASSMGLVPGPAWVLELGHRWGSCSLKGALNFHWKALAVPLEVLHYLVIHELAHVEHRDHSQRFWQAVEAEMPGWQVQAKWLAEHGSQMTL